MKQIILTESQMKRLMKKVVSEQTTPPPAPGTAAPLSGVASPTPDATATDVPGDAPVDGETPPVDGEAPVDGAPLTAGGDTGGGSTGAFDDGGAGADSNSKMHKWSSGVSRGKANPLGDEGPWESGVSRGAANQIGVTKWEDTVGTQTSRGRANELMESKKRKK